MNLYNVQGGFQGYLEIKFIKATSRQGAIIKFMESVNETYHQNIDAKSLCEVCEIIEGN